MRPNLPQLRKRVIIAYCIYLLGYFAILIFDIEPLSSHSNTFGLLGNMACLPLFWKGIHLREPSERTPWKLLMLGSIIFMTGESFWAYYDDFTDLAMNAPDWYDVFYIISNVLCLGVIFFYLRRIERQHIMSVLFDVLISVIALGGIMFNFIVVPIIADGIDGIITAIHLLYNPIFDVALMSGVLFLIFSTEDKVYFTATNLIFLTAFTLTFMLDELFMIENIYGIPFLHWINPFWSTPYFMLSIASLYPDSETVAGDSERLNKILAYMRILLPYIFTFTIVFLIGLKLELLNSVFLWALLMVGLLSVRQIFVLIRNKRLMDTVQRNEEHLKKLNAKITHDSQVDFLTQLSNRRHIDQMFERMIPTGEEAEAIGLILIDVDFFKRINDTFGHQIGDEVLQKVATLIRTSIRIDDIAGRFGGDEFIVLLPGADMSTVFTVSERLTDRMHGDGFMKEYGVSLSIGGSCLKFTRQNYDIDRLLKAADTALYQAKESGRDQFIVS